MERRLKKYCSLILFFLISFFPRLFLLSAGPFHYDSLDYIISGAKTLETFRIQYAHGVGYPLTVIVSAISQVLFGIFGINPANSVLIAGAVLGSLSVFSLYLFVYGIFKNFEIAFFTSLIFSFSPAFFSITTHGRIDHGLECIFLPLSFYLLIREGKASIRKYFISSLLLGLAIASRLSAAIAVLIWGLWYLFWEPSFKKIFRIKILAIITLGITIPPLIFYWPALAKSGLKIIADTANDPNQAVGWAGLFTPLTLLGLKWELEMLTILGTILILAGACLLFKEYNRKKLLLFLLWFLISFLYFSNIGCESPRYLIWPSFPLFIFAAYALYKIYVLRKYLAYIILAALIILQITPIMPILISRHRRNFQKEFASYVGNIIEDNSIILAKDEWIFLEYYIRNKQKTITSFPSTCDEKEMEMFLNVLDGWLTKGKNVYIVETGFSYDPCNLFINKTMERYKILFAGKYINEDWHRKCISDGLFIEKIFKLLPKT